LSHFSGKSRTNDAGIHGEPAFAVGARHAETTG